MTWTSKQTGIRHALAHGSSLTEMYPRMACGLLVATRKGQGLMKRPCRACQKKGANFEGGEK